MSEKMLGIAPIIHPTATVRDSTLGQYTEVGARTAIAETEFGDYSYIVHDGSIIYAKIGKFCSIAAFTRINPGNHATWRASQHHYSYRSRQCGFDLGDDVDFFSGAAIIRSILVMMSGSGTAPLLCRVLLSEMARSSALRPW